MNDFTNLSKRIIKFRNDRDWAQFNNPKDRAISLILEVSELLEHFQWKNSEEITEYLKNNKKDVSDELSDILYWVLLIANDLDINLEKSLSRKMSENEKKYPISKSKGKHTKYTEL
jgi:NTP pyrophosphatase (non-canonical NTP hydrolase)